MAFEAFTSPATSATVVREFANETVATYPDPNPGGSGLAPVVHRIVGQGWGWNAVSGFDDYTDYDLEARDFGGTALDLGTSYIYDNASFHAGYDFGVSWSDLPADNDDEIRVRVADTGDGTPGPWSPWVSYQS